MLNFKLTEDVICVDKTVKSKDHNRTLYRLYDQQTYKQCPKEDPWYVKVDDISEKQLYSENNITSVLYSKPWYVDDADEYEWNLYIERIYDWNFTCDTSGDTWFEFYSEV